MVVRHVGDVPAVRAPELEAPVAGALDGEAVLVDEAVMKATEQHEILLARRAAMRPVADVVRVEDVPIPTARKTAMPVATLERGPERRGDDAARAAVVDGAILAMSRDDQHAVAGQPPGGLGGDRGAVLELARLALALGGTLGGAGQRSL